METNEAIEFFEVYEFTVQRNGIVRDKETGKFLFRLSDVNKPYLCNATTDELLAEIKNRIDNNAQEDTKEDKSYPSHKHESHVTRFSDSSWYDEKCVNCGATDIAGGGWGKLAEPCTNTKNDYDFNGSTQN